MAQRKKTVIEVPGIQAFSALQRALNKKGNLVFTGS
jgi:hypothetical protein